MKLLVATGNRDKLLEFERILSPLGIEIISPEEAGVSPDVEETGETFAENAALKAKTMFGLCGIPAVADDSGLCVDALGGRPGVYSARYLGNAPQSEKNSALLNELEDVAPDNRTARFVCAVCCVIDNDTTIEAEGFCEGRIAYKPSGSGGFGYDPIFLVGDKSFGDLSPEEKDKVSHRGKALRELYNRLEEYIQSGSKSRF